MSRQSAPPEAVYIIRHGEKPQDLAPKHPAAHSGVDFRGKQNEHSLLPRGWQRSGALAALFDPTVFQLPGVVAGGKGVSLSSSSA